MKKNLITLIVLLATTNCFAQSVNFGIKGGLNFSKQVLSPGTTFGQKLLTGFNLGGIVDVGFGGFSIQPGLTISTKGERFAGASDGSDGGSTKFMLTYLEVPLNFLYRAKIAPEAEFHLGGGPYFAYGVAANASSGGLTYRGSFGDHSADPDYNGIYYKNPDYGINFLAGAVLRKQYIFDLQYGLGLSNLSYIKANSLKNRVIGMSVGYMFR